MPPQPRPSRSAGTVAIYVSGMKLDSSECYMVTCYHMHRSSAGATSQPGPIVTIRCSIRAKVHIDRIERWETRLMTEQVMVQTVLRASH